MMTHEERITIGKNTKLKDVIGEDDTSYKIQVASIQARIEDLTQQYFEAEGDRGRAETKLVDLKTRRVRRENEIARLQGAAAKERDPLKQNAMLQQVSKLTDENNAGNDAIADLEKQAAQATNQMKMLQNEIRALRQALSKLGRSSRTKSSAMNLETEIKVRERWLVSANEDLRMLKKELAKAEDKLGPSGTSKKHRELNEEIDRFEKAIARAEQELERLRAKLAAED
jgi:chromosome segregation ATPase